MTNGSEPGSRDRHKYTEPNNHPCDFFDFHQPSFELMLRCGMGLFSARLINILQLNLLHIHQSTSMVSRSSSSSSTAMPTASWVVPLLGGTYMSL